MLYIVYGEDTYRSREKVKELAGYFVAKTGETGVTHLPAEEATDLRIEELARTASLFSAKHVVTIFSWLQEEKTPKEIKRLTEMMAVSHNIFILWEEKLTKDILRTLEKQAAKIQEVKFLSGAKLKEWIKMRAPKAPETEISNWINVCGADLWCLGSKADKFSLGGEKAERAKEKGTPFALADAIASRRGLDAWRVCQMEILDGADSEDLFWKAWWQVKTLLTVSIFLAGGAQEGTIAKESALHPFVVSKASRALRNFSGDDIKNISCSFIKAYHESRRGNMPLNIALERILLKL